MATPGLVLLHTYKTTFLLWLLALFVLICCLLVGMGVGFPLVLRGVSLDMRIFSWAVALIGPLLPILGLALWLFVPAITTHFDPGRRVVIVASTTPLRQSRREVSVAEIEMVRPTVVGSAEGGGSMYSLALLLKNGETVLLEKSSTGNRQRVQAHADRIWGQIKPYA